MDGPHVNMMVLEECSSAFSEGVFHSLINIRTCSLHIIHGSLPTAEAAP